MTTATAKPARPGTTRGRLRQMRRLYEVERLSLAGVGLRFGLTRQRVSQIFQAAGVILQREAVPAPKPEAAAAGTTANTLEFPATLYDQIRRAAEARRQTIRDVVYRGFRAEIQRARRAREVGGDLYRGTIGGDPFDLRPHERTWTSLGRTRRVGQPTTVFYTFVFTAPFWQQIKGLAAARRQTIKALAVDVIAREMQRALTIDGRRPKAPGSEA